MTCPLGSEWRKWSTGQNFQVPPEAQPVVRSNRRRRPDRILATLDLPWVTAPNDCALSQPPPGSVEDWLPSGDDGHGAAYVETTGTDTSSLDSDRPLAP